MELTAYLNYRRISAKLRYWRSVNKQEVDFLVGENVAIEVKATSKVQKSDLSGLVAIKEEGVFQKYILVSHDLVESMQDNIRCIHWKTFLKELWQDELIKNGN